MYKDGGIVDKIFSFIDYRRDKRFIKNTKKFIGKRHLYHSTWGFEHNGHRYHLRIKEVD